MNEIDENTIWGRTGAISPQPLTLEQCDFAEEPRSSELRRKIEYLDSLFPSGPTSEPKKVARDDRKAMAQKSHNAVKPSICSHTAVALWSYRGCEGTCVMCLQSLMKICGSCESGEEETQCAVVIGDCGHSIHEHCFKKFQEQSLCLSCRQRWIPAKRLPLN